jgi:uncharacterized membrane protein YhfC
MVPTLSILNMVIAAAIAIGLPVALFLMWKKRYDLKLIPLLVGAGMFVAFALVLEPLLHQVILKPSADGDIALMRDAPLLFVLYAALAAGIFEETARLIAFTFLKRRYEGIGTGLSYGIGHGGIEAILLAGLVMINNIVLSIMINTGFAAALGDLPQVTAAIDNLINTDAHLFLIGGLERIAALAIQISLSVLMWIAVNNRKLWLYPVAIALHALIDVPAALAQAGILKSTLLIETIVFALAAATVIVAVRVYRKQKSNEPPTEAFPREEL